MNNKHCSVAVNLRSTNKSPATNFSGGASSTGGCSWGFIIQPSFTSLLGLCGWRTRQFMTRAELSTSCALDFLWFITLSCWPILNCSLKQFTRATSSSPRFGCPFLVSWERPSSTTCSTRELEILIGYYSSEPEIIQLLLNSQQGLRHEPFHGVQSAAVVEFLLDSVNTYRGCWTLTRLVLQSSRGLKLQISHVVPWQCANGNDETWTKAYPNDSPLKST